MSMDLTSILKDWPYEPGQITVRVIEGDDGEPKIQVRLDLGLLQMEVAGRPDGQRPYGFESLLEYYETGLDDFLADSPEGENFQLSADDCRLLREESVQYYHRYISLLVLGDADGVVRDTSRNLRVLDLCRQYAERDEDRQVLEQFRSYITMMRTRALASQMVAANEAKAALLVIDEGIEEIRRLHEEAGHEDGGRSTEIQMLQGMRDELVMKLPASQKTELRRRLQEAIEQENYELAAI
ncbi:MAG: hypothetical protein KDA21_02900, partial [Phycisphaerales bacterium]|nr:hypothetical protein [Phycisphaerales bacterium]